MSTPAAFARAANARSVHQHFGIPGVHQERRDAATAQTVVKCPPRGRARPVGFCSEQQVRLPTKSKDASFEASPSTQATQVPGDPRADRHARPAGDQGISTIAPC